MYTILVVLVLAFGSTPFFVLIPSSGFIEIFTKFNLLFVSAPPAVNRLLCARVINTKTIQIKVSGDIYVYGEHEHESFKSYVVVGEVKQSFLHHDL